MLFFLNALFIFILCFFVKMPFIFKILLVLIFGIVSGVLEAYIENKRNGGDDNDVDKTS